MDTFNSNIYYGELNLRFEKRASELNKLGYKYTRTPYGAMFLKNHYNNAHYVFAASFVMVASDFDFQQKLTNPMCINKTNY